MVFEIYYCVFITGCIDPKPLFIRISQIFVVINQLLRFLHHWYCITYCCVFVTCGFWLFLLRCFVYLATNNTAVGLLLCCTNPWYLEHRYRWCYCCAHKLHIVVERCACQYTEKSL